MLLSLTESLASLVVKGTATSVATKIKSIQSEKDAEKVRNSYGEIVSELLQERNEAVTLAQAYEAELKKVVISDEDIKHLQGTVTSVINIIKKWSPEKSDTLNDIESLKEIISVDTLRTLQLLGFNYKAAIGEPLTEICKNQISSWGQPKRKK